MLPTGLDFDFNIDFQIITVMLPSPIAPVHSKVPGPPKQEWSKNSVW